MKGHPRLCPDPRNKAAYDRSCQAFKKLCKANAAFFRELKH